MPLGGKGGGVDATGPREGDRFEEVPGMMTVQWLERCVQAVAAANEGQDANHECRHNDDRGGNVLEEPRHLDAA